MIPLLFSFWMLVVGQSTITPLHESAPTVQDVYARVPEAERQEFRAALESLGALEKSGKWGEVYDRFYLNDKELTREQFVHNERRLRSVVFLAQQIYYVPPAQTWIVSGCAMFSPPLSLLGKKIDGGVISDFSAKRTTGGWRFEAPPAITIHEDSPAVRSCTVGR